MVIETINELVRELKKESHIQAIGLSSSSIPQRAGEGDIDFFVYCSEIPEPETRQNLYPKSIKDCKKYASRVFVSEHWGDADYSEIDGIETWIMYFRIDDVANDFERIIRGKKVGRENGYYPSGRLAMFKKMMVLLDKKEFLAGLKERLDIYPEEMGRHIREQCIREMHDEEDLVRACERKDILFFHVSIDNAVDALLQYLFVINKELFPSRKRNIEIINGFSKRPDGFIKRVKEILRLGTSENSLSRSLEEYRKIRAEVMAIERQAS